MAQIDKIELRGTLKKRIMRYVTMVTAWYKKIYRLQESRIVVCAVGFVSSWNCTI